MFWVDFKTTIKFLCFSIWSPFFQFHSFITNWKQLTYKWRERKLEDQNYKIEENVTPILSEIMRWYKLIAIFIFSKSIPILRAHSESNAGKRKKMICSITQCWLWDKSSWIACACTIIVHHDGIISWKSARFGYPFSENRCSPLVT